VINVLEFLTAPLVNSIVNHSFFVCWQSAGIMLHYSLSAIKLQDLSWQFPWQKNKPGRNRRKETALL